MINISCDVKFFGQSCFFICLRLTLLSYLIHYELIANCRPEKVSLFELIALTQTFVRNKQCCRTFPPVQGSLIKNKTNILPFLLLNFMQYFWKTTFGVTSDDLVFKSVGIVSNLKLNQKTVVTKRSVSLKSCLKLLSVKSAMTILVLVAAF